LEALRETLEDPRRLVTRRDGLEEFEIAGQSVWLVRSTRDEIGSTELEDRRRSSWSAALAHTRILTSLAA